jgi:hypothetical protein
MHAHEPVYIIFQFLNCLHDYDLWLYPKAKSARTFSPRLRPPPQANSAHCTVQPAQAEADPPNTGAGQALIYCVANWPKIRSNNSKCVPKKTKRWAHLQPDVGQARFF